VTTQPGEVLRVGDGISTVIDLTAETSGDEAGSERGVLGIAFDPRDGRMFINMTNLGNDTEVISFEVIDGVGVPESRRTVMTIDQPGVGHNGGRLLFDAAGNLYIGSGDGGASNGRDAQDTSKLLGALLRITPRLDGDGYDIPPDNPFADGVADRPEVLARGFRNPWSFSLDDDTGDLWIGDVGNSEREEIDVIRAGQFGQNFGWPYFEGTNQRRSSHPDGLSPPVYDWPRTDGVAAMGGYVYRGSALPALRGAYLFGDLTGPVWALGADGVSGLDVEPINTLVGWGEDPGGELYLLGLYDGVFRLVPG
jgi:glucose/arabinose dehydrogenase